MQFEYIDENLQQIMQNLDRVLYLRPYDVGNKKALFAIVKEGQGVYKKVQITKEQSKLTFPFEPISCLYNGIGYIYLKDFMCFNNWLALNTTNLDGFKCKTTESKVFDIAIFAVFNDGSATFVKREKSKVFNRKGGIELYINLLKQYKEYNPKHSTYEFIECHSVSDNTFIIPELQEKVEEQVKGKKLIKD